MKQALIVGGTGMLAPLTPWLIGQGFAVTVIGRRPERLHALLDLAGDGANAITPVALDYFDLAKLHKWLEHVQLMQGPFDVVVAWIHHPKEPVLRVIDEEILAYRHDHWRLIDIQGSREKAESLPRWTSACQYQRVTLGYRQTPGGYRWLTHEEVVEGIQQALLQPGKGELSVGETAHPLPDSIL